MIETLVAAATMAALNAQTPGGDIVLGTRQQLTQFNTITGPTGLFNVPTAYVVAQGNASLGTNFTREYRTVNANFGLFQDVEVGAAYLDRDNADNKFIASAKVRIVPANFEWLEIGIGFMDPFDAVDQTFYAVASADLLVPDTIDDATRFKVHLGYGSGFFRDSLIAGAELSFQDRFAAIGEYDGRDFNFGVRYIADQNLRLQLGVVSTNLAFGATYVWQF